MFFTVSGGAFTLEGLVAELGPGLALTTLVLVPLMWSLPEVLLIAELASMLPEEGGYYRWVERAFGPFWAFQCGWCTWMYSLVDMAIYPVLFNQYLAFFTPHLSSAQHFWVSLLVIWTAVAVNLRGAGRVGRTSIITGAAVLGAFGAVSLLALWHQTRVPFLPFVKSGEGRLEGLGVGISIALWNYIGWDNPSTVQGEIVDASRSYPRALAYALPLVAISYLVPLLAALGATDWTVWREGAWPELASAAVGGGSLGQALSVGLALAGLASALALFNSLLLSYSRIPLAMASDGFLPGVLARLDPRGIPRNAVLASAVCYSAGSLLSFQSLVVADVFLYGLALFLEFAALLELRRREPGLRGAFRVPLGLPGLRLLAALPLGFFLLSVWLSLRSGEYAPAAALSALGAAAMGPLAFMVAARLRRRRESLRG
jgi:amino acid transporter